MSRPNIRYLIVKLEFEEGTAEEDIEYYVQGTNYSFPPPTDAKAKLIDTEIKSIEENYPGQ